MRVNRSVGCGSALLMSLVFVVVAFFASRILLGRAQEPNFITIRVDVPENVVRNEPFELRLTVQNIASDEILLHSIDISNSYLSSINVINAVPEPTLEQRIPIVDFRSFRFEQPIVSGGTQSVVFELVGTEEGVFDGEVDVCVEASVLCKLLVIQTVVGDGNGR